MSFAKTPLKQNWIIITTFYFEVTKNKNNFNGEYNTWVHVLKKKNYQCTINFKNRFCHTC